jgi:predicted O-linked N-acetylglucosamine transferase (SPINDLY family)
MIKWDLEIQNYLDVKDYAKVIDFYEARVEALPEVIENYFLLGLAFLLNKNEESAQASWIYVLSQQDEFDVEQLLNDLIDLLEEEATQQARFDLEMSWLIRQHIHEFNPKNISNIFDLVQVSGQLEYELSEIINTTQIISLIRESEIGDLSEEDILKTLICVLDSNAQEALDFAEAAFPHAKSPDMWVEQVRLSINKTVELNPERAIKLIELCLELMPDNLKLWNALSANYAFTKNLEKSIDISKAYYEHCTTPLWKALGSYAFLRALMAAGYWSKICDAVIEHKRLMTDLLTYDFSDEEANLVKNLVFLPSTLQYYQDSPQENRYFQNQLSQIYCDKLKNQDISKSEIKISLNHSSEEPIKLGFIANTFTSHSVGWLSRWFFQKLDRNKFDVTIYFLGNKKNNLFTDSWFANVANNFIFVNASPEEVAAKIAEDEIGILLDLDSTTFGSTCEVLASKPAPIQVTWLGFDASGLPSVDYFIADPYILPEDAQSYYQEKIWRLPKTYIAVNGFEFRTPTLRRDELNIPVDSTVFLSAQTAYKRNPALIRLQMEILKGVPDSHFLIKGPGTAEILKKLFIEISQEVGIAPERLHFLEPDIDEFTHRANLRIADVILDTYPYNGATTTLEALWMGLPIVTKVGQQFAARNSYAFMTNAGLIEGIASTDEEYVDWGIRLGTDEQLRQSVAWKLQQSRKTSPLWNVAEFTREMENSFSQMWQIYKNSVAS